MSLLKKLIFLLAACCLIGAAIVTSKHPVEITITGLDGALLKNAEAQTALFQEEYKEILSNEKPSPALLKRLQVNLKQSLEPYGYFKATTHIEQIEEKNKQWKIIVSINKGVPLQITHIDVRLSGDGEHNPELKKFIDTFPIKINSIFQADTYESAKATYFQIANNQGYIQAFYEKSAILIDLQTNTATLILHLNTGARYYIGKTTFNKNPYSTEFLSRFLNFHQGEPFSNQKILLLEQKMTGSYYFKQVTMTPKFDHIEEMKVPIDINVVPPKSKRYTIGVGYGTFTGPRLTATGSFRRITDTGQHLDVQLRLSSVLSGISGKYFIPGKNPLTDNWIIGAAHQRFLPADDSSISQSIFAGYSKKTDYWQFTTNLNYLTERYTQFNIPTRRSNLLYPNATLAYTDVDDLLTPHFGKHFSLMVQGTSKELLSATSFFQTNVKAKYVTSPFSFARIITRGEFGYTVVHDLNDLPLTMRFFAGGLSTIRGFPESSIGPGRYMEIASIEYQNKIIDNFSGALFYDIGTASNHFGSKQNEGAGIGIIYNSFIGNLKLYAGRAISKPGKPYSIEFSMGPDF